MKNKYKSDPFKLILHLSVVPQPTGWVIGRKL